MLTVNNVELRADILLAIIFHCIYMAQNLNYIELISFCTGLQVFNHIVVHWMVKNLEMTACLGCLKVAILDTAEKCNESVLVTFTDSS